jgi:photosystem II stability/assembly factor-like uncharacterized protein
MVLVIVASTKVSLSVLTPRPPSPPRSDDQSDVEALEALIEEARRRTRRRRRGYAALLVAAAAALIGYFAFDNGGGSARSEVERDGSFVGPLAPSQPAGLQPARGIEGASISALAVDPHSPQTVFAATRDDGGGSLLYKSANGGRTWESLGLDANRFDALAIAPGDPQTVYVGTGDGVFKSTDGGTTWQGANGGLFRNENWYTRDHRMYEGYVYSLVVDPRNAETVYAGTWSRGLLKTTNGGASWQRLGPGWVGALALDPNDPETIYVGAVGSYTATAESGVSKSTDGGRTWQPAGLQGTNVEALAVDPEHAEILYASTDKGLMKSTDGGENWHAGGLEGWGDGVMINPERPTTLYARTDGGIFKSRDGARTWTRVHADLKDVDIDVLVLDPSDSKTLYAGSETGVLKSTDSGASWKFSAAGMTGAAVEDVAAAPGNSAYALVSSQGLFKRARDGWGRVFAAPAASALTALAVDPQSPETLYVATDDGRIYRTSDGGDSWKSLGPSIRKLTITTLAVDPQNPRTLYAGNDGKRGIVKSSDGGATWRALPRDSLGRRGPDEVSMLAIDPRNPSNLHAFADGDYLNSHDGGTTWNIPDVRLHEVGALALDPSEPTTTMYVGTTFDAPERYRSDADTRLFKSTDGGTNWRDLNVSFGGHSVNALAVNPQARQQVYAGTDDGLFASSDGGESWRRYEGGDLLARGIEDLAIDPSGRTLYIGGSAGVFELSIAGH